MCRQLRQIEAKESRQVEDDQVKENITVTRIGEVISTRRRYDCNKEAATKGAREELTEASKSRKNQDDTDKEKRSENCDKEKQRNHDKGKTIRKRRRGLRQG